MKKILSILLCIMMLTAHAFMFVSAETTVSGIIGDNLMWKIDGDGTLTISGTGKMTNFTSQRVVPWCSYVSDIKNVVIESGVTSVSSYSFNDCINLKRILFSETVENISSMGLVGCTSLEEIFVNEKNENYCSVDGVLFNEKKTMLVKYPAMKEAKEYEIPSVVTLIGSFAFENCKNLEGISIPKSVTYISGYAFSGCTSLIEVTIPNSVTYISGAVFRGCTKLEKVLIPASVTDIGSIVFYGCPQVTVYGYADSYAKTYADENDINFVELPTYSFGQSVQIGLIEPWFLKANARVYTDEQPINIDYSTLVDYGVYFIRKSALSDKNATQDILTVEDIINDTDSVKYSKSAGTATIDGSYITASYDKGLYTYELDDSVFVLFYIEDENGITYAPIRERNLKSLLEARCNDTTNFPNELEREVYQRMLDIFNAIKAYRDDYFANN